MEGGSAHTEQPLAPLRKRRVGGQEPPSHLFPSSCHRAVGWQIRALMFGTKGLPHAPPPKGQLLRAGFTRQVPSHQDPALNHKLRS